MAEQRAKAHRMKDEDGREMKARQVVPGIMSRNNAAANRKDKAFHGTAQTIKKVATALFAGKGFKGTSVKDITEHANVNIAAINYHFGSKEALLQEIVKDYASINLEIVVRTLKKRADNLTELRVIFDIAMRELFEIANEYRDVMGIIRREIANMSGDIKNILSRSLLGINDILIDFIESGKDKNIIDKDVDAMQVVLMIYSYITTLSSDELLSLSTPYNDKDIANLEYREYATASLSKILFYGILAREK